MAKYFAILPAIFAATYALRAGKVRSIRSARQAQPDDLGTPESAILSAIIFNALVIPALVPLALRGVSYRPVGATALLRRNLLDLRARRDDRAVRWNQGDRPHRPRAAGGLSSVPMGSNRTGPPQGVPGNGSRRRQDLPDAPRGPSRGRGGRDVVIGYLEPHDRPETAALADRPGGRPAGCARARRRRLGDGLADGDRSGTELALVDQLAHTNAPGSSTASVTRTSRHSRCRHRRVLHGQRPASREPQRPTHRPDRARVRETLPDAVLGAADELVLIDLTARRSSSVCGQARSTPRSGSGPRPRTSSGSRTSQPLRELALRQVAEEVEVEADRGRRPVAPDGSPGG